MTREELIKSINKDVCHLWDIVHELIKRAISKDEEILATHMEKEKIPIKKTGVPTVSYNYYILTKHNFIRIFAFVHKSSPDSRYSYNVCPLNRFMGLEEKYLPEPNSIAKTESTGEYVVTTNFSTKLRIKIYFDVADENLHQITLTPEKVFWKKEIETEVEKKDETKKFVSALMEAVSGLQKKTGGA